MERRRKTKKAEETFRQCEKGDHSSQETKYNKYSYCSWRTYSEISLCTRDKACVCNLLIHAGRSEKKEQCKQSKMKISLRAVTYLAPVLSTESSFFCPPGHQGWWWYSNTVRCLPHEFSNLKICICYHREGNLVQILSFEENNEQQRVGGSEVLLGVCGVLLFYLNGGWRDVCFTENK